MKHGRSRRRRALLPAVAIGLVLGLGASALGGEPIDPNLDDTVLGSAGGFRYASDADPYNPSNSGYAFPRAGCGGPAYHATGGGAALSGPLEKRRLSASRPLDFGDDDPDFDDGWDASGHGGPGGSITAFAVCARFESLRYVRQDVPDSPTGIRAAKVPCPDGRHVLGGGIFIATSESFVNSTYPYDGADRDRKPDDGWAGRVLDTIGGFGGMEAYAICKGGPLPTYRKAAASGVEENSAAGPKARCPRAEHVSGGGVRISGPGNRGAVTGTMPLDRGDAGNAPDDAWRGSGLNLSGTPKRVTAFAICLP